MIPSLKELRSSSALRRSLIIPLLILAVTGALAALVVLQELADASRLEKAVEIENELRMQSCSDHIADYFDSVYSTLFFISLDNDVVAMRRDSRDYIQRMYDHQREGKKLVEIYVVERDFRGDKKPFMTFERGSDEESVEKIHALDREQAEYQTQIEQIRQFNADPSLTVLLSDQLQLCTPADKQGHTEPGFVYSVPIRAEGKLVGIVAGMIRAQTIIEILGRGSRHPHALLVSEDGDIQAEAHADLPIRDWFQRQFASGGATNFFAKAQSKLSVAGQTALWQVVQLPSAQKWWLIYSYDPKEDPRAASFSGLFGHLLMAGCILLAGGSMAILAWTLGRRLAENRAFLQERKQLEWQVQEVGERTQRRIGRSLREDLCQRLAGISAFSSALTKKLAAANVPEAQLASEITQEIKESLSGALHMADELQHVSLLQHGFLASVKELVTRTQLRSGISSRVVADDFKAEIEISVATQLFRIVQEAVVNVVQHSKATHLVVELTVANNQLTITVTDDGIGDAQELGRKPDFGLRIMRYRSGLIGAELDILPAPGKGIIVRCSCPVSNLGAQLTRVSI